MTSVSLRSSVTPYLVNSVGHILMVSLTPLAPTILSPPLFVGFPRLCLVFVCGSLYLLLSFADKPSVMTAGLGNDLEV